MRRTDKRLVKLMISMTVLIGISILVINDIYSKEEYHYQNLSIQKEKPTPRKEKIISWLKKLN
ncbi:TPA: hypothetical protein DEP21_02070 [Patescibacteria group bacterium]|nr:hypothetical protein [Candidatus Gracilibacteria bacterium]